MANKKIDDLVDHRITLNGLFIFIYIYISRLYRNQEVNSSVLLAVFSFQIFFFEYPLDIT